MVKGAKTQITGEQTCESLFPVNGGYGGYVYTTIHIVAAIKVQDAIINDVIIYPEMDISRSDYIVHRDRLLKKAYELDTPDVWKEYRVQRNKTFRSIRRAKSSFFHDSLQNSRDS